MPIPKILHIILMLSMIGAFVAAALLATRRAEGWFARHRLLAFAGIVDGLLGVSAMAWLKIQNGYPHFQSPHSLGGLSTLVLALVTIILGLSVPRGAGTAHKWAGRLTVTTGILVAAIEAAEQILE